MPDLGAYTGVVLSAYGVALIGLCALAGFYFAKARRTRKALRQAEADFKARQNV